MMGFTSQRLHFRELRPEDVSADYTAWLNDPEINRFLETRFSPQDETSIRAFVASQAASPDAFLLRVGLRDCETHIGNIKLGPINRSHASAQISLLIGSRSHHGQGYATEAINAVTAWGFAEHGLARIEAGCYAENLGSLRAFLKAGYTVEGFRRAAVITTSNTRSGAFWFARLVDDLVP
jgi:RimJ/RimL family protein N-acetyltransferase